LRRIIDAIPKLKGNDSTNLWIRCWFCVPPYQRFPIRTELDEDALELVAMMFNCSLVFEELRELV